MFYDKKVPVFYQTLFFVPDTVLVNIMAGIVYRNTKFGYHKRIPRTSETMRMVTGTTAGKTVDDGSIIFMHPTKTDATGGTDGKTLGAGAASRTTLGLNRKASEGSVGLKGTLSV